MRWLAVCLLAACARSSAVPVEPPRPPSEPVDLVPTLAVTAPERGAFVEGAGTLVVSGRVHDDGVVRVTVNGADASVAPDGTFTASFAVASGMATVETHAIDTTGHDVRDVRAVLVGPFAPTDGTVRAPIGASLGPAGLAALAAGLASSLNATDFTAAARAIGPLFERDGCLGARGDVASVTVGKLGLALEPKRGAIAAVVTAEAVEVRVNVRYTLACLDGDTTVVVRTNVRGRGELRAVLAGGRIRTQFAPSVDLDNFTVDVPGVPGPIERLLRGLVRVSIEHALTGALAREVPPLADAKLAELLGKPPTPAILGRDLRIDVVPRRVELAPSGVVVAGDAALVIAGGSSGRYVVSPARIGGAARDLGVWIAVDAINQVLAGLWAAHAFDRTIAIAEVGPLALFLGNDVGSVDVALGLPPTASVGPDGTLELAIGELGVTLRDASQVELQRFALSLRTRLAVDPGSLAVTASEPIVLAQVVSQRATAAHPIDREVVEGIVKTAWALVAGSLTGALLAVPMGAVELRGATARDGMVVLELSPRR